LRAERTAFGHGANQEIGEKPEEEEVFVDFNPVVVLADFVANDSFSKEKQSFGRNKEQHDDLFFFSSLR
jgi:hypothetical protein